jgi:enoyl-CoA hydratase
MIAMFEMIHRGRVCVLQVRHGKANALDVELCHALVGQLEELRNAPAGAIVLTGEGRIFSAGVDLVRLVDSWPDYLSRFLPALSRLFEVLFSFPKPVVAAINGHAIAGGCVLACAADYRIMSRQEGRIGVPELLVGVPFPTIALEIMRFAVAPQHLQPLLYQGSTYSAEEAMARGLVDAIVEPGQLSDRSVAVAEAFAALPAAAFTLTKQQLREGALKRIREDGVRFDTIVQELWARPESLGAIKEYVARTFKRADKESNGPAKPV